MQRREERQEVRAYSHQHRGLALHAAAWASSTNAAVTVNGFSFTMFHILLQIITCVILLPICNIFWLDFKILVTSLYPYIICHNYIFTFKKNQSLDYLSMLTQLFIFFPRKPPLEAPSFCKCTLFSRCTDPANYLLVQTCWFLHAFIFAYVCITLRYSTFSS